MKRLLTRNKTFTEKERYAIFKLIASHQKSSHIIKWCKEWLGKEITNQRVNYYQTNERYRPKIMEYRKAYESEISDDEFSSKRRRIQELTEIYYKLKTEDKLSQAAHVMGRIDEVVEGRKSTNTIQVQYNKFEGMTTQELIKKFESHSRILLTEGENNA